MANFGIYILLVNNSSYTIGITYDAIDGKEATGLGTLYPHTRTSIMYAEDSWGPHGAEGTFTFTLKDTDPKDNVVQIYADCPYSGANEFEIKKTSQFLKFSSIRFSNDEDDLDGDPSWGQAEVPESGHPLAIQIIVEDNPISDKLSVMTYNTHLFEGSAAEVGAKIKDKVIVYKDDERASEIVKKIKANPPDILCLEEVWSNDMRKKILDDLKDTYPYVYLVPDEGTNLGLIGYAPVGLVGFLTPWGLGAALNGIITSGFTGFTDTFTLNGLIDKVTNSSGLLLLSHYPLSNFKFTMYTDLSGDDKWAKKGVCTCDVTMPVEHSKLHTFRLGFTHAPTTISEAQQAIKLAVQQTMDGFDTDKLLVGDFNLHQGKESEYIELSDTMTNYSAHDVVYQYAPNICDAYTDDTENKLTVKFFGEKSPAKDRIDYIYFAPGSQNHHLEPKDAQVIHDWTFGNDDMPLSDHYPVIASFEIVNP